MLFSGFYNQQEDKGVEADTPWERRAMEVSGAAGAAMCNNLNHPCWLHSSYLNKFQFDLGWNERFKLTAEKHHLRALFFSYCGNCPDTTRRRGILAKYVHWSTLLQWCTSFQESNNALVLDHCVNGCCFLLSCRYFEHISNLNHKQLSNDSINTPLVACLDNL